jgi:monosaccharide-transporting ATPase
MSASVPLLRLDGIGKRFVGVQALTGVDFDLVPGEVHAVLGENGAGKSTLIRIMTGADLPDAGVVSLDGNPIRPASPAEAQRLGISAVYQEVNLLPNLSVAHNLFLGREPRRNGCICWKAVRSESRQLLERFGLDIDVTETLSSFSIAVQQLIAIARGVHASARVLVLDEPTASLDAAEVSLLFDIIEELRSEGVAIVFVTHFLDQVYAISDRITVLRNGARVGTWGTASLSRSDLISQILGRELESVEQQAAAPVTRVERRSAIEAENLSSDNGLRAVAFSAREGETLGLAGLLGAGRTELCETLFGLAARTDGSLSVFGREERFRSPAAAIRRGIALCPEDRKSSGIVGRLSVRENGTRDRESRDRVPRRGKRSPNAERRQPAETVVGALAR